MPINPESVDPRPCPRCGARVTPVPIVYGLPTYEAFLAAERGEIQLGGCLVGDESPDFLCPACHAALPWVSDRLQRAGPGLAPSRLGR